MTTYGFVLTKAGLPEAQEQKQGIDVAAGEAVEYLEFEALTSADVADALAKVRETLGASDVLVVSSLGVLGLADRELLTVVHELGEAGVALVAAAEKIDTRDHSGFFDAVAQLEAGAEAARRAKAGAIVARALAREAVTPQKAEFIPVEYADLMPEKDVY